jgi:tetratricopeptide (TPR) repeat protein
MNEQALEQLKQLFSQGRLAEVEAGASEQLKAHPQHPLLHKMLGICLFQRGEFARAQASFETALQLEPDDANCLNNLGSCYLFLNQHSKAASYFQQALKQGDNPEWHRNLGTCYFELGLFIRAAGHYHKAIEGGIKDDAMLVRQIDTLKNASRFKQAMAVAEQIKDGAQKLVEQAAIDVAANRPKQARATLAKAQGQFHFSQPQLQRLHDIYRFLGERDKELDIVNRFANGNPQEQLLAAVMQPQLSDQQLAALEQDPRLDQCQSQVQATFYFILASHYKQRDKTRWLALIKQANQIQAGGQKPDISTELECFKRIRQRYGDYAGFTTQQPSRKPVFILGMPRSGTTLVESILGNHPDVFAAGESTLAESLLAELNPQVPQQVHPHQLRLHYLDTELSDEKMQQFGERYVSGLTDYDANARYITDKMPHNFMHLGWLAHALPEATFIHCQRDPVATCLSVFEQNLSPFHRYGNYLTTLAEYYQAYQSLMAFWEQELPGRIINISYEQLVQEPEQTLLPVLRRLRLKWHKAMLDLENTERSVTTSSLQQVRKGIYKDALTPYAGLESDLAPLMALKPEQKKTAEDIPQNKKGWLRRLFG